MISKPKKQSNSVLRISFFIMQWGRSCVLFHQINQASMRAYKVAKKWSENAPEFHNIFKHISKGK